MYALNIWKRSHWSFFVFIQGLDLALLCFEQAMDNNNLEDADFFLKISSAMMSSSGAAMTLAGSFKRQDYEKDVRPSMTPPNVQSNDFSGLASLDHAFLVSILIRLKCVFKELPSELNESYEQFIRAYDSLMTSHMSVCEKFGGKEVPSLRSPNGNALDNLEKLSRGRSKLIDPNNHGISRCPFHQS